MLPYKSQYPIINIGDDKNIATTEACITAFNYTSHQLALLPYKIEIICSMPLSLSLNSRRVHEKENI